MGLASSVAMLALAAVREAEWWGVELGEAVEVKISPFKVSAEALGVSLMPPIIEYLTLSAWLLILAASLASLIASFTARPWSRSLMSFSASKIVGEVVAILAVALTAHLAAGALSMGLSSRLAPLLGGAKVRVVEVDVPLLAGEGAVVASISWAEGGGARVELPIRAYVTPYMALAIVAAALSLAARVYQGRLVKAGGYPTTLQ